MRREHFHWDAVPAQYYDGTSPAAGAEYALVVPAGKRWLLLGWYFKFVADANVANRTTNVYVKNAASGKTHLLKAYGNVTAGQTAELVGHVGVITEDIIGTFQLVSVPYDVELPAASQIITATGSIQAGDDYTEIQLVIKEAPA